MLPWKLSTFSITIVASDALAKLGSIVINGKKVAKCQWEGKLECITTEEE
eukprot:m.26873 g.26873  ORF g.26873 m.26873 type:complete len:50 (-) comp7841_c0_seq3:735-884(-)